MSMLYAFRRPHYRYNRRRARWEKVSGTGPKYFYPYENLVVNNESRG